MKSLEVVKCVLELSELDQVIEEQEDLMKELTINIGILRNDKNVNVKEKAIELESLVKGTTVVSSAKNSCSNT